MDRITRNVIEDDQHDHDRGLSFDLATLVSRRRALQLFAVGGLSAMGIACGSSADPQPTTGATTTSATTTASDATTTEIPEETAGPYPGDGSNGPNVLTESEVVRSDIRSSFGSLSGTAEGVALTVSLRILDIAAGGAPLEGAAVYLWHCDRDGNYSLYSQGVTDQNYLRGVQVSDADGRLSFTTVFPGCYPGRWPHMHFEVYSSMEEAASSGQKLVTSQLALPAESCAAVYATAGYESSAENLTGVTLESDNVFSDGYSTQLGTVTGSPGDAMTVALNVGV